MSNDGDEKDGGEDMHDQQWVDDLAAAYALDALSPEERALFEAKASPAARREAEELADTATLLAGTEVAPPPALRASLLDAIRAEPQDSAEPQHSTEPRHSALPQAGAEPTAPAAPFTRDVHDASAPTTGRPGPAERRARARWRPARVLGAVAAGAALLAGGIAIGSQLGGASQQESLGAVIAAPDAQRSEVELEGGGTATVVWSPEQGQSVILFDGLGAAPDGQTYQAWYIDAAGPHSAGVFQAAGGSTAVVLEGEMDAGVVVGVTVEPEGGSEAPTTEPFLVVET